MKESSRFVQIPPACARAYVAAVEILKRKLNGAAPDFETLIRRELRNRDPEMIAADYLEAHRRRRPASTKNTVRTSAKKPGHPLSTRAIIRGYSASFDPARN